MRLDMRVQDNLVVDLEHLQKLGFCQCTIAVPVLFFLRNKGFCLGLDLIVLLFAQLLLGKVQRVVFDPVRIGCHVLCGSEAIHRVGLCPRFTLSCDWVQTAEF